jgi:hypothetical protein
MFQRTGFYRSSLERSSPVGARTDVLAGYNFASDVKGHHPINTCQREQLESRGRRNLDSRAAATTRRAYALRRSGRRAVQFDAFGIGQIRPERNTMRRYALRRGVQKTIQVIHTGEYESYVEHRRRVPDLLWNNLVFARDQPVARQLHDRPDSMGRVRRDRGPNRDRSFAGR